MGAYAGAKMINDGVIFAYDHDDPKSFVGAPVSNWAYHQSARIDNSYDTYENTASGSWPANHSDAITVFNDAGTNISNYVNTGVTDYTNTQHAIWTYDEVLRRPVVTMRDWDGEWKAKHFSTTYSMTGMGLASTDEYTISWLQWTDNTAKSVNAGLYGLNNVAANGFHDGLAHTVNQATTQNTKTHTWERVYCTFTVDSTWDFTATIFCYMYGQYAGRGTVKICDVQIESNGFASGFSKVLTRSNTEAMIDRIGGNTFTVVGLTYSSVNNFEFDGVGNYFTLANPSYPAAWTDDFSYEAWVRVPTGADWHDNTTFGSNSATAIVARGSYAGSHGLARRDTNLLSHIVRTDAGLSFADYTATVDTWYHLVGTWNGSTTNTLYVNGEFADSATVSGTGSPSSTNVVIGGNFAFGGNNGGYGEGEIPVARMYNKELTASEVRNNFNALRGRFGI